MSFFRINIYLTIKLFILSWFISEKKINKKIDTRLKFISKKKNIILTSQLRVAFMLTLEYLKKKYPKKKEIIINSYNLAEMANICKNLGLKIVFTKLNENLFLDSFDLKKKINRNTLAVVTTNIFNTYNSVKSVKSICQRAKVPMIEDNAIYFGNYKIIRNRKIFSGSFGDYVLNSFNIMKNISAMYGGSVSTNDREFVKYANKEIAHYKKFPIIKFLKQTLIFIILKILKIKLIYKYLFIHLIKKANKNNNLFILGLVYPSIKFKLQKIPKEYFTQINKLSKKMIYIQLYDRKNFDKNHIKKKYNNIYYYKTLKRKKIKQIKLIKHEDSNFQNFNDFPILVKKKKELVNYLFSKGIETKTIQYIDCQNIFSRNKSKHLDYYEDRILCLPNHLEISKEYINYIIDNLIKFYEVKSN